MNQNRLMLLLFSTLVLLSAILYWFIWGNKSYLTVEGDAPFIITIEKYRKFECTVNVCKMDIPMGTRQVCIVKEGFLSVCEEKALPWKKQTFWHPVTVKTPTITTEKPTTNQTTVIRNAEIEPGRPYITTPQGKKYLFDDQSDTVFEIKSSTERKTVVRFYGIETPSLYSSGENLLLVNRDELYFVDPVKKEKHRIFQGKNLTIKPFPNGDAALFTAGKTRLFDAATKKISTLPITTTKERLVSCEPPTLAVAESKEKNTWVISLFSPDTGAKKTIASVGIDAERNFALYCTGQRKEIGIAVSGEKNRILRY